MIFFIHKPLGDICVDYIQYCNASSVHYANYKFLNLRVLRIELIILVDCEKDNDCKRCQNY